jgi:hypothetical protein
MDMQAIEQELEALRQQLPDPFAMSTGLDAWFASPAVVRLIARGDATIDALFAYLQDRPEPALARVAVLLLTRFDPQRVYPRLLPLLGKADITTVAAFEPGWWLIDLPPASLARDLVRLARESGNPTPLLLLQRPAAREVKTDLLDLIRSRRDKDSLFALYALRYALDPSDVPLLREVEAWTDAPEASAVARELLATLEDRR